MDEKLKTEKQPFEGTPVDENRQNFSEQTNMPSEKIKARTNSNVYKLCLQELFTKNVNSARISEFIPLDHSTISKIRKGMGIKAIGRKKGICNLSDEDIRDIIAKHCLTETCKKEFERKGIKQRNPETSSVGNYNNPKVKNISVDSLIDDVIRLNFGVPLIVIENFVYLKTGYMVSKSIYENRYFKIHGEPWELSDEALLTIMIGLHSTTYAVLSGYIQRNKLGQLGLSRLIGLIRTYKLKSHYNHNFRNLAVTSIFRISDSHEFTVPPIPEDLLANAQITATPVENPVETVEKVTEPVKKSNLTILQGVTKSLIDDGVYDTAIKLIEILKELDT